MLTNSSEISSCLPCSPGFRWGKNLISSFPWKDGLGAGRLERKRERKEIKVERNIGANRKEGCCFHRDVQKETAGATEVVWWLSARCAACRHIKIKKNRHLRNYSFFTKYLSKTWYVFIRRVCIWTLPFLPVDICRSLVQEIWPARGHY